MFYYYILISLFTINLLFCSSWSSPELNLICLKTGLNQILSSPLNSSPSSNLSAYILLLPFLRLLTLGNSFSRYDQSSLFCLFFIYLYNTAYLLSTIYLLPLLFHFLSQSHFKHFLCSNCPCFDVSHYKTLWKSLP